MGIELKEIIRFLKDERLCSAVLPVEGEKTQIITGFAADEVAQASEIAWCSPKTLHANAERLTNFKGAALICPENAASIYNTWLRGASLGFPVILCPSPKLAFIRVVNEFFSQESSRLPLANEASISPQAEIHPSAVLSHGVVIGSDVSIGPDVHIGANTVLNNCSIEARSRVGSNCSIGFTGFGYEKDDQGRYWRFPHIGRVLIGKNVEIGSNTCIDRGALGHTVIEDGVKIDNLVHIAHNVRLGQNAVVIANAMVAGSCVVEDGAWIAPSASIRNQITIGADSVVGLAAVVTKSVEPKTTVAGNPAKPFPSKT